MDFNVTDSNKRIWYVCGICNEYHEKEVDAEICCTFFERNTDQLCDLDPLLLKDDGKDN